MGENGAVDDARLLKTFRLPFLLFSLEMDSGSTSGLHPLDDMIAQRRLRFIGGPYEFQAHQKEHGYVPIPLRLLVQHLVRVILLIASRLG